VQPVGDVGGRLLGVLVGEELQSVGRTRGLGEPCRSPQQLLRGGKDKLGLSDRLGRIVQHDRVPGQVSHFAGLVGHRELGPVHRNARTKKSAFSAPARRISSTLRGSRLGRHSTMRDLRIQPTAET
jgi:hypothetical protein